MRFIKGGFYWKIISLAVFGAFLSVVPVSAAEFSADMIQKTPQATIKGKVYVKGTLFRQEMEIMGQRQITLFNRDKNTIVVLMPQNRMYMEMPASAGGQNLSSTDPKALKRMAKTKSLGTARFQGYRCEKVRYTFHDSSLGTMVQWFSKKLRFPLKIEMDGPGGRMVTEYRNIKEGNLSDSLFRIPRGYQKMSMPGMMRGMGGMRR